MAEVHLFGDYLNLHGHSIAARGEEGSKGGEGTTQEDVKPEERKRERI